MKICSAENCDNICLAKGLCGKHYNVAYHQQHRNEIIKRKAEYRLNNREKTRISNNTYYAKPEAKLKVNEQRKNRRRIDPAYKMRLAITRQVARVMQKFNIKGEGSFRYVPYTKEELKMHLEKQFESWMNWSNHGNYDPKTWNDNDPTTWTWHLDHIIPQAKLPYTSVDDDNFKRCWALNNLRPYSAKQNVIEQDRRARKETK